LAEAYVENIEKNNTLQGYLNYDLGVIKNKLNNHTSVFIKAIYASTKSKLFNIIIVFFVITVLSILYNNRLSRKISKQLGGEPEEITDIAQQIASGNLTVKLNDNSENNSIYSSMRKIVVNLKTVVENIKNGSEQIAAASLQISSTSQQVSQGASEQASSIEEVSSSMEEMVSNIQQNSENASKTEEVANKGANEMTKMQDSGARSLKAINNIADKITIVNDIAFQTNILALNAAVEAARAGEYGKGFAVVASEVRKLAEKSQNAADEIIGLSQESLIITKDADKMVNIIGPEIGKTAQLIQEIAGASIEQSSGVEQVNNAIQQLNQVTQQNAAASEEMATSSEELNSQAEQLKKTISFFRVNGKQNIDLLVNQAATLNDNVNKESIEPVKNDIEKDIENKNGVELEMYSDDTNDKDYEKY
ncbi:MAG: methyl-accepting chemotaxis protein, partial [Bacteroidota bacterium]|nr:methyl-accepting chemotaxis protein [Bacteroidota bacterium]